MLGNLFRKKSNNPLFIRKGEALLQIDGRVYKLPKGVDSPKKYQDNEEVRTRTIQLAREYGTIFEGFRQKINCLECRYTGIFAEVEKRNEVMIFNGPGPCNYPGRKDIALIGLFTNDKRKAAFLAKESPCTVRDAHFRTLVEQGYLDKYLLKGIEPGNFPSIRDFEPEGELEKKASQEYLAMQKH